jgi:recombination protein RecA
MDREDKIKARDALLKKLNKDHGQNTIGVYADMPKLDIETISSGSLGLDAALGVGGWARGRMVEIWGSEASGKTTLTLHAIAEAQKTGGLAAFIDAEHALDPEYAANLGVDMDGLVLSQPDSGEQALNLARELVESNAFDIVVIDSVAALTPIKEIEGEVGDYHVGAQARMMSQALRKLAGPVHKSKTTLVFINQTRQKIGVMFGNPTTTSGGKALAFYATQRVEIARIGNIKKGDDVPGCRTRCTVKKNKVAPPFRKCEFDIIFGKGINKAGEVLDAATTLNIVSKSGAWYSYNGDNIGQGRDATLDWFSEHQEEFDVIEAQVRAHYGF